MQLPLFVKEVQETTGLDCEPIDSKGISKEYWVLSPTGLRLFKIGGCSDGIIGMVSLPDMYQLQGISDGMRHARRKQDD